MITRIFKKFHDTRRFFCKSEWLIRWLGIPKAAPESDEAGFVLIQIDGFSRTQFERALESGKMPFLKKLMKKEEYRLHTLYSGLPSSTPSVQGELFYGVKQIVPAFRFRDHTSKKVMGMLDHKAASMIEERLRNSSEGILKGGSAYCDIYGGGAQETHFCPSTIGWGDLYKKTRPLVFHIVLLFHGWAFIKTAVLMIVETVLAILDFFRGIGRGQNLVKEFQFILSRVGLCVLMRELITLGTMLDIARGIPLVHLNFVGYDEQAHRRGPSSKFAHWSLKGIDAAIRKIWKAASHSHARNYAVWVYSDHGQEETRSYIEENGKSVQQSINELFVEQGIFSRLSGENNPSGIINSTRAAWLGTALISGQTKPCNQSDGYYESAIVAAQGPVGLVYPPCEIGEQRREELALKMIGQCKIPLVLFKGKGKEVKAFNCNGQFCLPEDAVKVLGTDHPFLEEVTTDLVKLVNHPDSGMFVLSGWQPNAKPMTFPIESGAHAGPGKEETRAFALLPADVSMPSRKSAYFRPIDLHEKIKRALSPEKKSCKNRRIIKSNSLPHLRVMTYNVHSCIGMDGKLSPNRIAKVIAMYNPDVIALQELDANRPRTIKTDQAHLIARELEMEFHFHPAIKIEEEEYGDAILTRHPSTLVKTGMYPAVSKIQGLEPRGALWIEISVNDKRIQIFNTHIGLRIVERKIQINHLLGEEWLGNQDCNPPIIICGDFNTTPSSPLYRKIADNWQDVQIGNHNGCPQKTWFPHYPIGRIDHIFVSSELRVLKTKVPRTTLTKQASDHLPLIVDLKFCNDSQS